MCLGLVYHAGSISKIRNGFHWWLSCSPGTASRGYASAALGSISPRQAQCKTMLRQLIWGSIVSLGNIAVHAIAMTVVVGVAHRILAWDLRPARLWLVTVMIGTVGVLLVAHVAEVITWSLAYSVLGAAPPESDVLYFAFVNYTTLGYGDVLPVQRWRLLGPITAMNGVLLFGWSAAVIFEVLTRAIRIRDERGGN
jgi:Ion channel